MSIPSMNRGIQNSIEYLLHGSYPRFFITGASGALLNLSITWLFTTFFFGLSHYFYAYCIGLSANLVYNFILNTYLTFRVKGDHTRRFLIFIGYSLVMTYIQAITVKILVPFVGVTYYIFVIAGTIFVYSIFNFFVFKFRIFKEDTILEI